MIPSSFSYPPVPPCHWPCFLGVCSSCQPKPSRGGGIWGAGFGGTHVGQGRAAEVNVVFCLAQSCRL